MVPNSKPMPTMKYQTQYKKITGPCSLFFRTQMQTESVWMMNNIHRVQKLLLRWKQSLCYLITTNFYLTRPSNEQIGLERIIK